MSNKKVLNIVLIVIGALMILPLFVGFINFVQSAAGETDTFTASLFGKFEGEATVKDALDMIDKGSANIWFVITKIATIVGVIAAIAIAVFAALKLAGVKADLAKIEKIVALVAMIAGAVILIAMIIFFIASTKKMDVGGGISVKMFFSGAWGWYVAFIGAWASGLLSIYAAK